MRTRKKATRSPVTAIPTKPPMTPAATAVTLVEEEGVTDVDGEGEGEGEDAAKEASTEVAVDEVAGELVVYMDVRMAKCGSDPLTSGVVVVGAMGVVGLLVV